jgi:transcriptional regulator with XRE-family HTH domain
LWSILLGRDNRERQKHAFALLSQDDFFETKMLRLQPPNLRPSMASAVAKILDDLRARGGLKGTNVANITAVSPATVSRWMAGKAFPHPKTQLVISDLRYVVDRLAEFYSPDEARIWLYSKHSLLNGERAIDLIDAGRTDEVLAVIESLDQSTFT